MSNPLSYYRYLLPPPSPKSLHPLFPIRPVPPSSHSTKIPPLSLATSSELFAQVRVQSLPDRVFCGSEQPRVDLHFTRLWASQNICSRSCPNNCVFLDDGLFAKATLAGQKFHTLLGFLLMGFVYILGWLGSFLPIIGARISKQLPLMWLGYAIAKRVRLIPNLKIESYRDGGHHPHMLESHVRPIAKNIIDFVSA